MALVVLEEKREFGLPEVMESLLGFDLAVDVGDVYKELRQLEMSFIIELVGDRYHFVHRLFPETLRKSVDLYHLVDLLLQKAGV